MSDRPHKQRLKNNSTDISSRILQPWADFIGKLMQLERLSGPMPWVILPSILTVTPSSGF